MMKKIFINFLKFNLVTLFVFASFSVSANNTLSQFFTNVQTLQATFLQTVIDDAGETLEKQKGIFYLSRPGKFRWDYIDSGQQIIADGESIYMYDTDLEQVTVRSMHDAFGQIPSMLLVNDGSEVTKHFKVKTLPVEQGVEWVMLVPKQEDAGYDQLKIGFKKKQLFAIHLQDALGNDSRLQLDDVKQNKKLSPSLFKFVAPEGVDVLTDD